MTENVTPDSHSERREWTCSECGEGLVYPETRVLQHYDEAHGDEYKIGWYEGKDDV